MEDFLILKKTVGLDFIFFPTLKKPSDTAHLGVLEIDVSSPETSKYYLLNCYQVLTHFMLNV